MRYNYNENLWCLFAPYGWKARNELRRWMWPLTCHSVCCLGGCVIWASVYECVLMFILYCHHIHIPSHKHILTPTITKFAYYLHTNQFSFNTYMCLSTRSKSYIRTLLHIQTSSEAVYYIYAHAYAYIRTCRRHLSFKQRNLLLLLILISYLWHLFVWVRTNGFRRWVLRGYTI